MNDHRVYVIGIDLGKNWFHLVANDERGTELFRKKLNRGQLAEFAVTAPRCLIAMEACPGSQFWGRRFQQAGHELRIIPAQFVKPYLKSNKNDFNDAQIAEAASRGSMRCVPLKTTDQIELQALHRVRQRFIVERTAVVNQMRALLLEHGIVIPVGRALFARRLPAVLADPQSGLSPRLSQIISRLRQRWLALDEEIDTASAEITQIARESELCRRACTVPGVGPVVSTALIAAVGNGAAFKRARDMSAWLGLVPKQYSTGGKSNLGGISKRGNAYLRMMVIQGARALMIHMKRDQSRMGLWLREVEQRSHPHVALIALANKIVRICWKVLTSQQSYRPFVEVPATD
ncbi:IS110 family transposase [Burkholderia gladioli]|uniref:IS110 family transposase n=1 Tax=Burkholderia gladioli TaxID=28095 RepID=UPI00163F18E6|nr:IS110 family transposase [Burkholderia gladioli]